MDSDQRQEKKAIAGGGKDEQGKMDFHKTRTGGERSGASKRAPLVIVDAF